MFNGCWSDLESLRALTLDRKLKLFLFAHLISHFANTATSEATSLKIESIKLIHTNADAFQLVYVSRTGRICLQNRFGGRLNLNLTTSDENKKRKLSKVTSENPIEYSIHKLWAIAWIEDMFKVLQNINWLLLYRMPST